MSISLSQRTKICSLHEGSSRIDFYGFAHTIKYAVKHLMSFNAFFHENGASHAFQKTEFTIRARMCCGRNTGSTWSWRTVLLRVIYRSVFFRHFVAFQNVWQKLFVSLGLVSVFPILDVVSVVSGNRSQVVACMIVTGCWVFPKSDANLAVLFCKVSAAEPFLC